MKMGWLPVFGLCILLGCTGLSTAATPLDAISAYNRGVDLAMEGKFDEALVSIDEALSLDQNFTLAWITKAGILNVKGAFNDSLEASERALALDETQADAWTNRASALISLQQFEEGLEAANRAIELDPRLSEAWIDRATALSALGRTREADEAMQMAKFLAGTPVETSATPTKPPSAPLILLLVPFAVGVALLLFRKNG